jgi:hypothetical protein
VSLEPPPPGPPFPSPPPPPPPPPFRPSAALRVAQLTAHAFRSGWGRASLAAGAILTIVYVLNLLLAWLQQEATPSALAIDGQAVPNPVAAPSILRGALLSMFGWHGISADAEIALPQETNPFGGALEVSVSFTLMLGLGLVGYLLFRAGRRLAEPGLGWFGAVRGVQVALIYAALMLVLAIFGGIDISLAGLAPAGEAPDSISIRPSLAGAFFMPFLLATFAAGAGAVSGRAPPLHLGVRLMVAGITGGWRAAWLSVALASMGFLIVAALHPEITRAYLDLLPGGALSRVLIIQATLLVLPNVGTGIAAAAMGGSINVSALGDSCAVISFLQFPQGTGSPGPDAACAIPLDLGPAPLPYALFLLVPLAATIAGGWLAAQRAGATRRAEGAIAGLSIALPFAIWLWLLGLVARFGYHAGGFIPFEVQAWVGPGLVSTVLVALLWGAAGGAIGGALGAPNASGPEITPGPQANVSG